MRQAAEDFTATPSPADSGLLFSFPAVLPARQSLFPVPITTITTAPQQFRDLRFLLTRRRVFGARDSAAHNYAMSSPGALGVFAKGTVKLATIPAPIRLWFPADRKIPDYYHSAGASRGQSGGYRLSRVGGTPPRHGVGCRLARALGRRWPRPFAPAEIGCCVAAGLRRMEGLVNYTRLDDSPERIIIPVVLTHVSGRRSGAADADGNPLPPGEIGRLTTRGPAALFAPFRQQSGNTMPARLSRRQRFHCSGERSDPPLIKTVGIVQCHHGCEKDHQSGRREDTPKR